MPAVRGHNRAFEKSPPALFSHRSGPQRTQRVRLGSSLAAAALDDFLTTLMILFSSLHVHEVSLKSVKTQQLTVVLQ